MNNIELAIKFSNEKYCTKKDVMEAMKTPLIDGIWNSVLEYRSNFTQPLSLRHINKTSYNVCLTPNLSQRLSNIERKLMRIYNEYSRLNFSRNSKSFRNACYISILSKIAEKYGLEVDESIIRSIVESNVSTLSPELLILNRYYQSLLEIEFNPDEKLDEESIKKLYCLLMGIKQSDVSYRREEVDNSYSKVVINRLYLGVPVDAIEANMSQLFDFLDNSQVSMFIKSVCAFYFGHYIKPFDNYSEEIAILMLKKVLANNDIGNVACLFNFEELLSNSEKLESFIIESQKTFDLTYLANYVLARTEKYLDSFLDGVVEASKQQISDEIYQPEEENILNRMPETHVQHEETFVKEEEPEVVAPSVPKTTAINVSKVNYGQTIAIGTMPTGLSEEEATRLENHLLELNPNLSRGQAYFYARHCTLGMSYTISQYKKALGCAYETARSSMDHLSFLGYYRKDLLKNKYIYTPVKKG